MQNEKQKRQTIENYIKAYNAFDVPGMVQELHPDMVFENILDGEVNMRTEGVQAFREQAEQATSYFSERVQRIESIRCSEDLAEVSITYRGLLATDLPNGIKAGDELTLQGKSIFYFKDDKIIKLQDIS